MSYDPTKLAQIIGSLFILAVPAAIYGYYIVLRKRNKPEAIALREMEALKESGTPFTLVDVREPSEFKASPRDGAVNIPLSHIPYDTADWDRAGLYIVACAHGIRAKRGAIEMAGRGFRQVRYLQQ